jgi:siroheme synthase (precorrin-2 oxidase/ferrochelatase)
VAAAQRVAAASQDDLARAASGGAHYRVATLTRERLWALVEGPEIAALARKAAAEALVQSSDEPERARLRVAAERCAEPEVRIALRAMAEEAEEAEAPDAPPAMHSPREGDRLRLK